MASLTKAVVMSPVRSICKLVRKMDRPETMSCARMAVAALATHEGLATGSWRPHMSVTGNGASAMIAASCFDNLASQADPMNVSHVVRT